MSTNNNPSILETLFSQCVKVCYHNIHSLRDKLGDRNIPLQTACSISQEDLNQSLMAKCQNI